MTLRNGVIATRRIVGGSANNQIGEDIRNSRMAGQAPLLQKAVVVDVVCDPSLYTEEELQNLAEKVNNPELIDIMPVNSVIARIITNGQDISNPIETILFPFFPSNFQMPVVAGEQIYAIYEDFSSQRQIVGFWITRVSEQRTVEDVNYTHGDRRFQGFLNPQNLSTDQKGKDTVITQSFPNGAGTQDTISIRITGSNNENPYDGIVNSSKTIKFFKFEPIPRYKKRPGDFVLQGKNNSAIILGTDRNGSITGSFANTQAGSIDIVAGRSRILPTATGPSNQASPPQGSQPWITDTSRGTQEVNKAPYIYQGTPDSLNEGDPDYLTDAARLLITMQSEADISTGLVNNRNLTFPVDTLPFIQPNIGLSGSVGKSYILGKADNIRFIARNNETPKISGSILIIREGTDENNIGYFHIDDQANIQIFGPKIFIGKATGHSTNNDEPPEPYIKWTEYKKTVDHLQTEIKSVKDALQSELDAIKQNFQNLANTLNTAFAASTAIPFLPITSLVSSGGPIVALGSQVVVSVETGKTNADQATTDGKNNTDKSVEDSKSKRIFGE